MRLKPVIKRAIVLMGLLAVSACLKAPSPQPPATLLISIDTSTEPELAYATAFLDEFAFQSGRYEWLVVDIQKDETVANQYSNIPRKEAVDELLQALTQERSDDQALLASLAHAREYALRLEPDESLTVVLLTEGTHNAETLQSLEAMSQELSTFPHFRLFVAGVSEDNRLPLSRAFTPIEDQVQFFGDGLVELDELLSVLSARSRQS
ncbi:MAG: hypothetical protein AAFY26_14035 [Cyanobacteria bacterium J06638_22]